MTIAQREALIARVYELAGVQQTDVPGDWCTDDRLTFGAWLEAINELLLDDA
jgi:hypothetical protein